MLFKQKTDSKLKQILGKSGNQIILKFLLILTQELRQMEEI